MLVLLTFVIIGQWVQNSGFCFVHSKWHSYAMYLTNKFTNKPNNYYYKVCGFFLGGGGWGGLGGRQQLFISFN